MISEELASLLRGREERVLLQRFLLEISPTVVQITVNVPGYPKRIESDDTAVAAAECTLRHAGILPVARVSLVNAAGLCVLMSCVMPATEAKFIAIALEDEKPYGRAMDLDVIASSGAVSRSDLGFGPRRCIICSDIAKACARSAAHGQGELRTKVRRLLESSRQPRSSAPFPDRQVYRDPRDIPSKPR